MSESSEGDGRATHERKASHRGHRGTEAFRTQRRADARGEDTEMALRGVGMVGSWWTPHTEGTEAQSFSGHRGELTLARRAQRGRKNGQLGMHRMKE